MIDQIYFLEELGWESLERERQAPEAMPRNTAIACWIFSGVIFLGLPPLRPLTLSENRFP